MSDDERARGEVTLKDLRTGTQQSVVRADTARHVVDALKASNGATRERWRMRVGSERFGWRTA